MKYWHIDVAPDDAKEWEYVATAVDRKVRKLESERKAFREEIAKKDIIQALTWKADDIVQLEYILCFHKELQRLLRLKRKDKAMVYLLRWIRRHMETLTGVGMFPGNGPWEHSSTSQMSNFVEEHKAHAARRILILSMEYVHVVLVAKKSQGAIIHEALEFEFLAEQNGITLP